MTPLRKVAILILIGVVIVPVLPSVINYAKSLMPKEKKGINTEALVPYHLSPGEVKKYFSDAEAFGKKGVVVRSVKTGPLNVVPAGAIEAAHLTELARNRPFRTGQDCQIYLQDVAARFGEARAREILAGKQLLFYDPSGNLQWVWPKLRR